MSVAFNVYPRFMSWQVGPIRSLFDHHHAQRTDFVHTNPILLGLVILQNTGFRLLSWPSACRCGHLLPDYRRSEFASPLSPK